MELEGFVERVRAQLTAVADTGSEEVRSLAERMSTALDPAIRLALLELLSDAAGLINRELAPGGIDVRLRGREPELVVTRPADAGEREAVLPAAAPVVEDEPASFRTTLRLPERLKAQVEQAASAEGISVNTWLVRAVASALEPPRRPPSRASGDRFTGWVR